MTLRDARTTPGRRARRTRSTMLAAAAAATLAFSTGCVVGGSDPADADECPAPPAADVTTRDGWIGYLSEHPDSTSYLLDDGHGDRVAHDADADRPLASATKVVHLAAYGRAVTEGRLDPDRQVPVAEWNAWYLPGTDGGAHDAALARLGNPASVRLDDIVSAMIRESDNAAADYLRDRLGDAALSDAASAGGWTDYTPPTFLGSMVAAVDPDAADPDAAGDGTDEWGIARRYAADDAFRDRVRASVTPDSPALADPDVLTRIARAGGVGSASDLTGMHRSIADGSFGPGADEARRHLEWQPAPNLPDIVGMGFKGGVLPGALTDAMTLRRADGSVASGVLLVSDMSEADHSAARTSFAWQNLILDALTNPDEAARVRCVA